MCVFQNLFSKTISGESVRKRKLHLAKHLDALHATRDERVDLLTLTAAFKQSSELVRAPTKVAESKFQRLKRFGVSDRDVKCLQLFWPFSASDFFGNVCRVFHWDVCICTCISCFD